MLDKQLLRIMTVLFREQLFPQRITQLSYLYFFIDSSDIMNSIYYINVLIALALFGEIRGINSFPSLANTNHHIASPIIHHQQHHLTNSLD